MSTQVRQALNKSYNEIRLTSFPDSEKVIIKGLLRQAILDAVPYEGDYKADWLLEGGLGDAHWKTLDGNKTQVVDGRYKFTCDISFDRKLPDGSRLLDKENEVLLGAIQKGAFLLRCGLLEASPGPRSWADSIRWLHNLTDWAVLHNSKLRPKEYGFSLIDQNILNFLFQQLAIDGWVEALNVIPRLLSRLYRSSTCRVLPPDLIINPFQLPSKVSSLLTQYLRDNAMYATQNEKTVCRKAMAAIVNLKVGTLKTTKLSIFLRQFEPELQHPYLLISESNATEYPSQNTVLISDATSGVPTERSHENHRLQFNRFFPTYRHLPTLFPDPRQVDVQQAYDLSKHQTKFSGHHNLVPLNTGLAYLNESMRWVIVYGEAIINGILEMTKEIRCIDSQRKSKALKIAEKHEAFEKINKHLKTFSLPESPSQPLSIAINLLRYLRMGGHRSFKLMRNEPTLMEAFEILVGACVISIAMLKPARDEEVWSLKRSCAIKYQSNGRESWWMEFQLGKSGQLGVNQTTQKPIPYFTAKAIHLLQKLGDELSKINEDKSAHAKDLFYLPTNVFGPPTGKNVRERVNNCIDRFCDYVNLPTDQYGRRWYIRIHEMRKWFMLMMFWHGRYGVLDAVRWIAGHTDAKHTYAYIEANFPGKELPRLEAQCVDNRLIMLERSDNPEETSDLVALYDKVCKHFNVDRIEGIRGYQYLEYLEDLRTEGVYHIEPYSIVSGNGQDAVGIEIAVRFTEKA